MVAVRVHVLGQVRATEGGRQLRLGGPRQRLVLAVLVVQRGHPVPTERLMQEIWGDDRPATARKTLQGYVSHLRAALDDEAIRTAGSAYHLDLGDNQVDAVVFERLVEQARQKLDTDPSAASELLTEALGLWTGTPYADLDGEPALRPEISRLEELRLGAVEARIDADLAVGRDAELVAELESLVRDHPVREAFRRQHMLALYRAGRQSDALRSFQQARRYLADHVGVDPGTELQRLEQLILRQDPALDLQDASTRHRRRVAPGGARAIRGYELRGRVGRGPLAVVHRAFQAAVGREVALKVIHLDLARTSRFVQRFEVEATALARLEHPHLVSLYDWWRDPDGAFLVGPWMRGGSLAQEGSRPGSVEAALAIIEQVCDGLACAHRNGMVHGNLAPSNVLLDEDGNAYVADLRLTAAFARTEVDAAYAAPEVRAGDEPSSASDVFSLGMLIWTLLSRGHDRPGAVPTAFEAVVDRATAVESADRFARVEDLLRAVRQAAGLDVVGPVSDAAWTEPEVRNPYKGLRAFQEPDAADFFGRDALVARLLEAVEEDRLVGVVGPSGCGKSSAVKAGLVPALRAARDTSGPPVLVTEMFPGAHPFEELAQALERVAVDRPPGGLLDELTADELGLVRVTKRVLPDDGSELLLLVDQFEELFSLVDDDTTRASFLDSLVAATSAPDPRIRVLVTLRADFFDRPLEHQPFGDLLDAGLVAVSMPSKDSLTLAISEPARRAGLELEPGLVAAMVGDVAGEPGGLPLLQYALTELVDQRTSRRLALADYTRTGGVIAALGTRAEALYQQLSGPGQEALRQALLRMVTVEEDGDDTRRRVRRSELAGIEVDQHALDAALQRFGAHRLLSFDRDPVSRGPTVEVAHEALLHAWPRLHGWIDDRREDLLLERRYRAAVAEWREAGRDDEFLLAGGRLRQFVDWADATDLRLTPGERDLLGRSRAAEASQARTRRHRRRALTSLVAGLVAVALVVTSLAVGQRNRARREAVLATTTDAMRTMVHDPERSLLVGLALARQFQAAGDAVPWEVVELLHNALLSHRVVARYDQGGRIDLSPDGQLLAIAGQDGTVTLRDAGTGEVRHLLADPTGTTGPFDEDVAFSPDGTLVAHGDRDGLLRVTDAATGEPVYEQDLLDDDAPPRSGESIPPSTSLAFSADSGLLAFGSALSSTVVVLDTSTWEVQEELSHRWPAGVAFAPTGRLLAVAGLDGVARLWSLPDWRQQETIDLPGDEDVFTALAFAPDASRLVLTVGFQRLLSWNLEQRRLEPIPVLAGGVTAVDYSRDGNHYAFASTDGTVTILGSPTDREVLRLAGSARYTDVVFGPDGTRMYTADREGSTVVWDVTPVGPSELRALARPGARLGLLSFSPGGDVLATTAITDGPVILWDTSTWRPGTVIEEAAGEQNIPGFSPDGRLMALVLKPVDAGQLGIYEVATGERLMTLDAADGSSDGPSGLNAPVFSNDGDLLAAGSSNGIVTLWDTATWEARRLQAAGDEVPVSIDVDPSGRRIAVAHQDGRLTMWDARTLEQLAAFTVGSSGRPPRFSPDGQRIAEIIEVERRVLVRGVDTGDVLASLDGHTSRVWTIDWTPDGQWITTASEDRTARVWDAATGRELFSVAVGFPLAAVPGPDGRTLAVTDMSTGAVHLLTLDPEELVEVADLRTTRALTATECRTFGIVPCPLEGP